MKTAKQWVNEQSCPQEWASEREVREIQKDAREDLIKKIKEALDAMDDLDMQGCERMLRRDA